MKTLIFILLTTSTARTAPLPDEVKSRLRDAALSGLTTGIRIEIDNLHLKQPPGEGVQVMTLSPNPPLGLVNFTAHWKNGVRDLQTFGSAVIKGYARIAVAKVPIRHGEGFNADNTLYQERELSAFRNSGYFLSGERLMNLRANGFISPGQVIGVSQTQEPILVSPGQIVELLSVKGALKITAKMKALEVGRMNSWIRLENPSSKKVVIAKVTGPAEMQLR